MPRQICSIKKKHRIGISGQCRTAVLTSSMRPVQWKEMEQPMTTIELQLPDEMSQRLTTIKRRLLKPGTLLGGGRGIMRSP
jgi:hypothetical protein